MISSQKLIYAAFFILAFAVSGFSDEKEETASDSLSIHFTYGPGGPIRKERNFFAGEMVFLLVKVPKQMKSGEMSDLSCEAAIVSQEKPEVKIAMPKPLPVRAVSLKDDSVFLQFNVKIPAEFEKGRYDIGISVANLTNDTELVAKETVEITASTNFGIRNPSYFHGWGNTNWSPGSNTYGASETVMVMFEYSGLKANEENEVKSKTKVTLKDEKGTSTCISDLGQPLMAQKISVWEQNKSFASQWNFMVSQPGRYTLHIEVTDLNAGKTDSVELPLRVYGMDGDNEW